MNVFHFVRQSLGISQEALANLLGVSLSLLKKAETNRRNLPFASLNRLVWYYQTLQQMVPEADGPTGQALADLLQQCQAKLRNLEADIINREIKTRQMKMRRALQAPFQAQFPPMEFPQAQSQMMALDLEARTHLEGDANEMLLLLRARKAGLQATISFLKDLQTDP